MHNRRFTSYPQWYLVVGQWCFGAVLIPGALVKVSGTMEGQVVSQNWLIMWLLLPRGWYLAVQWVDFKAFESAKHAVVKSKWQSPNRTEALGVGRQAEVKVQEGWYTIGKGYWDRLQNNNKTDRQKINWVDKDLQVIDPRLKGKGRYRQGEGRA